jgi:hypothetical protein
MSSGRDSGPPTTFNSDATFNLDDSDPGCFASDSETECLLELNLRGADGRAGASGQSYFEPDRSYGADGRRGEDAQPAERGQDAASATIKVAYAFGVANSRLAKTAMSLSARLADAVVMVGAVVMASPEHQATRVLMRRDSAVAVTVGRVAMEAMQATQPTAKTVDTVARLPSLSMRQTKGC